MSCDNSSLKIRIHHQKNEFIKIEKVHLDSLDTASSSRMRFIFLSPLIFALIFTLACALASPYFEKNLMISNYKFVNSFLGKICHQYPSRSFYLFDSNIGLCARCFGIYLSLTFSLFAFTFIKFSLSIKLNIFILFFLCIPFLVDGLTQYWGIRTSNNLIRFLTGYLGGIGISIIFVQFYFKLIKIIIGFFSFKKIKKEGYNEEN